MPSLRAILKAGHEVAAVVTNQDEPKGRGLKVLPSAVKVVALELRLPLIQVSSLKNPDLLDQLKNLSADVMVVVAFRILPREVFSIPPLGAFNLHASLLPRYRGAAPINWAIVNGERETGVTTFFLEDKVDTGKIILQKKIEIGENETAGALSFRLSMLGAEAVVETLSRIEEGDVNLLEQGSFLSTEAPKIRKEDCIIEWSKPASMVHNFIRGFSPEPGAFTFLGSKMLRIFGTKLPRESSTSPAGSINVSSGRFLVACSDEFIEILNLQWEGKKRLSAQEFLRGARIESGGQFSQSRE